MRPLAGVRILDLSRLLPGPYATSVLRALGADVLRVESPALVDYARGYPPFIDGVSAIFHVVNRGKRSIGLDLKNDAGRKVFLDLVARHDVVFEQFRPGVLDRLGVGYDVLRRARPDVILCSLTGYGQTSPLAAAAGHDLNYQALAGLLHMAGLPGGRPPNPVIPTADLVGALHSVIAIQGALLHRAATGEGAHLDVSMTDALASLGSAFLASWTGAGDGRPDRGGDTLGGGMAQYRTYTCKDGGILAVGALEPQFWARFAAVAGHPEWAAQPAMPGPHQAALAAEVEAVVAARTRDEWARALRGVDCCVSPALEPHEAMAHPHFAQGRTTTAATSQGTAAWPEFPHGEQDSTERPPQVGEHTDEVLAELLGLDAPAIEALRAGGAVS